MKIFADTASLADIERFNEHPWISGFTTNPTIFKAVGVTDPMKHASDIVARTNKPVSIDGPPEKVWQLAENAIPKVVHPLEEVQPVHDWINHTAVFLPSQIVATSGFYTRRDIISVFAGRIMDTGNEVAPVILAAKKTGAQVLWASSREVAHIAAARACGCDIITLTPDLIDKMDSTWGMPVEAMMDLTIRQFEEDRIPW